MPFHVFIHIGGIDVSRFSCLYLKRLAQSNDRPHFIKQKNVTPNAFWGGYASAILSFFQLETTATAVK